MANAAKIPKLSIQGITKAFGPVVANDNVTVDVFGGTIHAILGENGAGKSTLMNILYGLYQPDKGVIKVDGWELYIDSPRTALASGIGMVHQHFMLAERLTVTENIILGSQQLGAKLNLAEHTEKMRELSKHYNMDIDPGVEVGKLPVGMQQRVEIMKLLYHNAEILILDEPTSVLTPNETKLLFELLHRLKDDGKTIIFITHKLDEVMATCDDVTTMRLGRIASSHPIAGKTAKDLARGMVGKDIVTHNRQSAKHLGDVVLKMTGVKAQNDRGVRGLDISNLQVRSGEVLGIAGVDGNGQTELAEVIAGLRVLEGGEILMNGKNLDGVSVADRSDVLKIAYVPEDRHRDGLSMDDSIARNLILRSYRKQPFSRFGLFSSRSVHEHAEKLTKQFDVRMRSVDQDVRYLSGGNQQKVILAREFESAPDLLVVAQPTKGLDVGAIDFVHRKILAERDRGMAVLCISTELEHLLEISDRIGVMFEGRIMDFVSAEEATSERIGLLMAGVTQQDSQNA